MAKEKKQLPKSSKKDFFYELSGTLTILLSLILLSELGTVGLILKKSFKVLFGDFYFIVVIYLIGQGIYALVKEKWFDFKSLRFNGFLLFLFSLFLIVHISFIDIYNISNQTILSETLELYKDALFSSFNITSYGGGIIGAILSQIFILLFNKIGALIFAIIFMILSITFMTNFTFKTLFFAFSYVFDKSKKIVLVVFRYFKNINYPTKKEIVKKKNYILNLNLLSDADIEDNNLLQRRLVEEEFNQIIPFLYQSNCYLTDKKLMVGYSYSRYVFLGGFSNFNQTKLDTILKRNKIIYKKDNQLIVESSNQVKRLLTLKKLLLQNQVKSIPLGIELSGNTIFFDPLINQNLVLSGDYGSGIKTFIRGFILTLIFNLKDEFNLIICDFLEEFNDLKYLPNLYYPINKKVESLDDIFDELTIELERRLSILNEFSVDNYIDLNEVLKNKKIDIVKPIFFIINNLDVLRKSNYNINNKILYFLKFGYKVGIHFIMVNRSSGISSQVISNTKTKLLFKCGNTSMSVEVSTTNGGCFLNGNGDVIMVNDLYLFHLQLPYVADGDFHKVISKVILN